MGSALSTTRSPSLVPNDLPQSCAASTIEGTRLSARSPAGRSVVLAVATVNRDAGSTASIRIDDQDPATAPAAFSRVGVAH